MVECFAGVDLGTSNEKSMNYIATMELLRSIKLPCATWLTIQTHKYSIYRLPSRLEIYFHFKFPSLMVSQVHVSIVHLISRYRMTFDFIRCCHYQTSRGHRLNSEGFRNPDWWCTWACSCIVDDDCSRINTFCIQSAKMKVLIAEKTRVQIYIIEFNGRTSHHIKSLKWPKPYRDKVIRKPERKNTEIDERDVKIRRTDRASERECNNTIAK